MARGSAPGERRGGRGKGTPNKAKAEREKAIAVAGITPRQFMLDGLAWYQGIVAEEKAKGEKADAARITAAYATGKEFAKDVAPYCHSRLAAVELTGKDGGPIAVSDARDRLARLLDREAVTAGAEEASRTTH